MRAANRSGKTELAVFVFTSEVWKPNFSLSWVFRLIMSFSTLHSQCVFHLLATLKRSLVTLFSGKTVQHSLHGGLFANTPISTTRPPNKSTVSSVPVSCSVVNFFKSISSLDKFSSRFNCKILLLHYQGLPCYITWKLLLRLQ